MTRLQNAMQTLTHQLQRVRASIMLTLLTWRAFVRDVRTLSARLREIDERLNDNENAIDHVERKIVESDDVQDMIDDAVRECITSDDMQEAISEATDEHSDELSKLDDRLSDVERDKLNADDAVTESDVERMIDDADNNNEWQQSIDELRARVEALEAERETRTTNNDAARDALRASINAAQEALDALDE